MVDNSKAFEKLQEFRQACKELRTKEENMKFGLDIFGIEPQFYSELSLVEKQTEQLQQIWDTKEEWDLEWDAWKDQKFYDLDTQQMEDRAGEILDKLKSFLNQD